MPKLTHCHVRPKFNEHGVSLLRLERTSRNTPLLQLSLATGIHYSRLSLIEGGLAISPEQASKIAKFYHKPVSALFDMPGEDEASACD